MNFFLVRFFPRLLLAVLLVWWAGLIAPAHQWDVLWWNLPIVLLLTHRGTWTLLAIQVMVAVFHLGQFSKPLPYFDAQAVATAMLVSALRIRDPVVSVDLAEIPGVPILTPILRPYLAACAVICTAMCFFKPYSIPAHAAYSVSFVLISNGLPKPSRGGTRTSAAASLLLLASIAVAAVLVEGAALRVSRRSQTPQELMHADPEYLYLTTPSQTIDV